MQDGPDIDRTGVGMPEWHTLDKGRWGAKPGEGRGVAELRNGVAKRGGHVGLWSFVDERPAPGQRLEVPREWSCRVVGVLGTATALGGWLGVPC